MKPGIRAARLLPPAPALGAHSGEAVIGDIGLVQRTAFAAMGDSVNAAFRLEGVAKERHCALFASKATRNAAGAGVVAGKRETIKVKGKDEANKEFEILGLNPVASRFAEK